VRSPRREVSPRAPPADPQGRSPCHSAGRHSRGPL
jgi:hypothetical protein